MPGASHTHTRTHAGALDHGGHDSFYFDTDWPPGSSPYQSLIWDATNRHGVPPVLLAWLLWKESSFLPDVVFGRRRSPAGAMGIAQFMPATARQILGSEANALVPAKAIDGAAYYLAQLYKATGSWSEALAAYNWGIGNVSRRGLAAAPKETVDYVAAIMNRSGFAGRV